MVHFWIPKDLPEDKARYLMENEILPKDFLDSQKSSPAPLQGIVPSPLSPGLNHFPGSSMNPKDVSKFEYYLVTIREDQETMLPRDIQLNRPSQWAKVVADAFMRHLCREKNAHSAELIRYSREPIYPAYMFMQAPPPNTFTEMVAHFGEFRRNSEEEQP